MESSAPMLLPPSSAGSAVSTSVPKKTSASERRSFLSAHSTTTIGRMNTACSLNASDSAKLAAARAGFPSSASASPHSAQAAYRLSHWANMPPFKTIVGRSSARPNAAMLFLPSFCANAAAAPARNASPMKETAFTA